MLDLFPRPSVGFLLTRRSCSSLRDWSGSCPFIGSRLSICLDFTAASQELRAAWIFLDPIKCTAELVGLAVRREDIGEEEHYDCTLRRLSTSV